MGKKVNIWGGRGENWVYLVETHENPYLWESYCLVDYIDACVKECSSESLLIDGLEACLAGSADLESKNRKIVVYNKILDKCPTYENQGFKLLITLSKKPRTTWDWVRVVTITLDPEIWILRWRVKISCHS